MNRRELLCALAAGGVMTAAGLWMPGQKLISIPSGRIYSDKVCFLESWTALPNGKWLKTLVTEDKIILSQEWPHCPYSFPHEARVIKFWLPRDTQWLTEERWPRLHLAQSCPI
jgi:hypothetical protein